LDEYVARHLAWRNAGTLHQTAPQAGIRHITTFRTPIRQSRPTAAKIAFFFKSGVSKVFLLLYYAESTKFYGVASSSTKPAQRHLRWFHSGHHDFKFASKIRFTIRAAWYL